jgi:hypothetical protein
MRIWNKTGIPHKGWKCIDMDEDEFSEFVCEMCDKENIRYKHIMWHEGTNMRLSVGCVCAGYMENDYENAKRRDMSLRNKVLRKKRFLSKQWVSKGYYNGFVFHELMDGHDQFIIEEYVYMDYILERGIKKSFSFGEKLFIAQVNPLIHSKRQIPHIKFIAKSLLEAKTKLFEHIERN